MPALNRTSCTSCKYSRPVWSAQADGKRDAEAAAEAFATGGRGACVVKPTAVYGTRHTANGSPIYLAPMLAPVSYRGGVEISLSARAEARLG